MPETEMATELIRRYSSKKLILDANLLLLWLTARYDSRILQSFKRVQMFSQADAELLAWMIDQFPSMVTTSYVVTETSNLGNSLASYQKASWFGLLASFCIEVVEDVPALNQLAQRDEFVRFGVTDCALSLLASNRVVLTTDYRFSNYAASLGSAVINFNDLRRLI